jgi:hypothetical protein
MPAVLPPPVPGIGDVPATDDAPPPLMLLAPPPGLGVVPGPPGLALELPALPVHAADSAADATKAAKSEPFRIGDTTIVSQRWNVRDDFIAQGLVHTGGDPDHNNFEPLERVVVIPRTGRGKSHPRHSDSNTRRAPARPGSAF